jgi:hypothetical protein
MKKIREKLIIGFIVSAMVCMLLACGTTGLKPKQTTELLDYKGAALGNPPPAWVNAYFAASSVAAVEALPEYKDNYCFVIYDESADKGFLLDWVNNLNGPAAIANVISTTVSQNVAGRAGAIEGAERERIVRTNQEVFSNASFTGSRKVGDWWQLVRNTSTKAERYEALALYIFSKKVLDDQIARNLQNIVDNNAAISAAERAIYSELINEIRVNGDRKSVV